MFFSDWVMDLQSAAKFNTWIPLLESNWPQTLLCSGIQVTNPKPRFGQSSIWVDARIVENPVYFERDCENVTWQHPEIMKSTHLGGELSAKLHSSDEFWWL